MITTMRGCVVHHDLWPWPISSRSFDLDFENRVRSVASTVLDGFFLCLAQMITIIRRCVACYVFFRIWKFKILANFWNFSALTLKKKSTILAGFFPYLTQMITSMRRCVAYNDLWPWPISSRSFGLDLENRVLSVASTVLDGFFPYVVQMITSMRRCVACDDLWPWPISSRSFGLDLENRVLSVASTVLDGFFPYLVQMISSMRRCVACDDLWPWPISSRSFDLDFENRVRSVTFSVLDRLFFWLGIQYDSIMWVIMRRRGVSSERRRSSYSSWILHHEKDPWNMNNAEFMIILSNMHSFLLIQYLYLYFADCSWWLTVFQQTCCHVFPVICQSDWLSVCLEVFGRYWFRQAGCLLTSVNVCCLTMITFLNMLYVILTLNMQGPSYLDLTRPIS